MLFYFNRQKSLLFVVLLFNHFGRLSRWHTDLSDYEQFLVSNVYDFFCPYTYISRYGMYEYLKSPEFSDYVQSYLKLKRPVSFKTLFHIGSLLSKSCSYSEFIRTFSYDNKPLEASKAAFSSINAPLWIPP